jgi:hypothetical protein
MKKQFSDFPYSVIMAISLLMCQHICQGDAVVCGGSECHESRLGDLLVRVTEGNKEAASIGSYTIALYRGDSDFQDFIAGLVRPRDGGISKVWLTQLDKGKEPEIIVWMTCAGTGAFGKIDIFRFTGDKLVQLESPKEIKLKGGMGHDTFKMNNGKLFRLIPVYNESDPNSTPTGGTTKLVLDFKNMEWIPVAHYNQ